MRIPTAAVLVAGVTDAALAHTPDGDSVAVLSHHLVSAHHLPAILLLAVILAMGFLVFRGRAR